MTPSIEAVKALDGKIFAMLNSDEQATLDFYRAQSRKHGVIIRIESKVDRVALASAKSKEEADTILKGANSIVHVTLATEDKQMKNAGSSLPSLQKEAFQRYGYGLEQVLHILQQLYERGLITYPRTDNGYLPVAQYEAAQGLIRAINLQKGIEYNADLKKPVWVDNLNAVHHGIIPTDLPALALFDNPLTEQQINIYRLVYEGFVDLFSDIKSEAMA